MPELEYYIIGNSYEVKEDLKAMGCKWSPAPIKKWRTPKLKKDEFRLIRIENLARATGCTLVT